MRSSSFLPALLAAAIAVASPARAAVAPQILGGRPAPSAEGTVALRNGAGSLACSGVLVGARAVLTAAHCFPLPDADASLFPHDACFGPDVRTCTPVRVIGHEIHPRWDVLSFTFDDDLAVVFLESDAPATPVALSERAPVPGEEIEIFGYGRTDAVAKESAGEKHGVVVSVLAIADGRVVHGEGACKGDSGGPLFAPTEPGAVVAITSSGPAGCRDSGRATLVGPHVDFIRSALVKSVPPATGAAACASSPRRSRSRGEHVAIGVIAAALAFGRRRTRKSRAA